MRNRAAILRKSMIGLEEDRATGGADLASVRAERKQLESTIENMPERDDDFEKRDQELLGGYKTLTRDLSKLDVELLGMDARIIATELKNLAKREPRSAWATDRRGRLRPP